MFSTRLPPFAERNRLSRVLATLRADGVAVVDLTESNPTRAAIPYPEALLAPLANARGLQYEPDPLGLAPARAAVAADQRRRGADIDPGQVMLTASTSEAYSWLFKLLCSPGDRVLVPAPSYPLFEHLTRLEGVWADPYRIEYDGRWRVDFESIAAAAGVRAVLIVTPNNPTGSFLAPDDLERLSAICRERGWAIVADEVFADYPLDAAAPVTDVAARADVLSFTLAGLSKTVGLPQLKLGWAIVGGPLAARQAALAALELIADTYLSVSTPVQLALSDLLLAGGAVRDAIRARIAANLVTLRSIAAEYPACDVLRTEGGWSAVVRVPSTRSEEQLVVELLRETHVLVHPGFFFDFPREAYVVLSLLPPVDVFAAAVPRVLRFANS